MSHVVACIVSHVGFFDIFVRST